MDKKTVCPICGKEDLVITTQYRKTRLFRVLTYICVVVAAIMLVAFLYQPLYEFILIAKGTNSSNPEVTEIPFSLGFFVVAAILSAIFYGIQQHLEKQIIAVYTCKTCGHTWIKE